MTSSCNTPQAFDIKIGSGQLVSPFGAMPGSLTYVFRRALAESYIDEDVFTGRVSTYVREKNPNIGIHGLDSLSAEVF